jgi:ribosome-binding factor A
VTHKVARASGTIQRELGLIISNDLSDPRLPEIVSVTRVDLAPDLSVARVFISVGGGADEMKKALEALQSAAGRITHELESRIRIRRLPRLTFMADDRIAHGDDMSQMIDRVLDEDRRMRTRRNSI